MSLGPGRTVLRIPFTGYHFEAVSRPSLFRGFLRIAILTKVDPLC